MIIYNRTSYKELTLKSYQKEKRRLQIELLKLQEWVINSGQRLAIVLEGRDAAGKGATIKRFIENLIPKTMRVVELGVPTATQNRMWFKTYERLLPSKGEIVFFDRSWYTRGLIQPAMGYCTERQYKYFMKNVNKWEETQTGFEVSFTMPVGDATAGINVSSQAKEGKSAGTTVMKNDTSGTELWYTVPIGPVSLSIGYGSAAVTKGCTDCTAALGHGAAYAGDATKAETTTTTQMGAEMSMSF